MAILRSTCMRNMRRRLRKQTNRVSLGEERLSSCDQIGKCSNECIISNFSKLNTMSLVRYKASGKVFGSPSYNSSLCRMLRNKSSNTRGDRDSKWPPQQIMIGRLDYRLFIDTPLIRHFCISPILVGIFKLI